MLLRSFTGWVIVLMVAVSPLAVPSPTDYDASQVEAAFVLNIVRFTDWPPGAFANATDPIRVVTIGDNTVHQNLYNFVQGKSIGGRRIKVFTAEWDDIWNAAHLVLIKETDPRRTRRILDSLGDSSILTIGTTKDFILSGGMIRLYTEESRMRFDVNLASVERARIRMRAQVLTLANRVIKSSSR